MARHKDSARGLRPNRLLIVGLFFFKFVRVAGNGAATVLLAS